MICSILERNATRTAMKGNAMKQADLFGRSRIWDGEGLAGRILERRGADLAHIRPERCVDRPAKVRADLATG